MHHSIDSDEGFNTKSAKEYVSAYVDRKTVDAFSNLIRRRPPPQTCDRELA